MKQLLPLLLIAAGCGDDGASGSKPDAAIPIDAQVLTVDCQTYCGQLQQNCGGDNAQYAAGTCMTACASFDPSGTLDDMTGNTLGCRVHYAIAAKTAAEAPTDCASAGLAGGALTTPGACSGGDVCAAFCALEIKACGTLDAPLPGDPKDSTNNSLFQYRNMAGCLSVCNKYDKTHAYGLSAMGDSLACRLYEAIDASISLDKATVDCAETGESPHNRCMGTATP